MNAPPMTPSTSLLSMRMLREVALTVAAIAGVLCLLSTAAAIALDVKPVIFRSGSMAPAIETGALAFSRTVPAEDLRVGDVVTVPSGTGALVTHRIEEISLSNGEANLVLRGDANAIADDRVYVVEAAPRVLFDIPQAGRVVAFATGPIGVFASGVLVALILVTLVRSWRPGARVASRDDDPAPDDQGRTISSSLTVGATILVGLVVAAGAATATDTWAYYQDSASATSGTFSSEAPPPSGCEQPAPGGSACLTDPEPRSAVASPEDTPSEPAPTESGPSTPAPDVTDAASPDASDETAPGTVEGADGSAP